MFCSGFFAGHSLGTSLTQLYHSELSGIRGLASRCVNGVGWYKSLQPALRAKFAAASLTSLRRCRQFDQSAFDPNCWSPLSLLACLKCAEAVVVPMWRIWACEHVKGHRGLSLSRRFSARWKRTFDNKTTNVAVELLRHPCTARLPGQTSCTRPRPRLTTSTDATVAPAKLV